MVKALIYKDATTRILRVVCLLAMCWVSLVYTVALMPISLDASGTNPLTVESSTTLASQALVIIAAALAIIEINSGETAIAALLVGSRRRMAFSLMTAKVVSIVVVGLMLTMVNAIGTFEKYSIFELHGDELDEPQDLTEYQAGYLPDGAILQDTTKQPNTEPGIVLYEYAINEAESFEIMITQSDNRVYFDTENTKIEPFDKGGVTGYFFQKDGMSCICFERDSCFFSVYGSIDTDELVKIAASITKK